MTPIILLLCSPWLVVSSPAPHPNPTVVARQPDPTPNFFNITSPEVLSPWSSALPIFTSLSNCRDMDNPSEACGISLNLSTQGYLYTDGTCSSTQSPILLQAAKDAYCNASNAVGWYDDSANTGGIPTAHYYMGPDADTTYKDQIDGPIKRVGTFNSKTNNYIIIHCNDPKGYYSRKVNGMTIGGYAWTKTHWFWWNSYHINMCDAFYIMSTIAHTKKFLQNAFKGPGGSYDNYKKYAGDLTWLQLTGTTMLHEMMHTDLIGNPGPHIDDEWVDPDNIGRKAYGPKAVWQLAKRAISKGGGAKRASTNADSYAQMMTAMYWWKINGFPFPGVPGKPTPFLGTISESNLESAVAGDDPISNDPDANDNDAPVTTSNWDTIPIFLDIGNATDPSTDWDILYTAAADPSFFPTPIATATATAAPTGLPSNIANHSVCGGCGDNGVQDRYRK